MRKQWFTLSAEQEAEEHEFVFTGRDGIWNTIQTQETQLPDQALAEAVYFTPGTLSKVQFAVTSTSTNSIAVGPFWALFYPAAASTYNPTLLISDGDKIYTNSVTTSTSVDSTASALEFVQYKGDTYYRGTSGTLHYYNGSVGASVSLYTPSGSEPANLFTVASASVGYCQYIEVHEDVMYFANNEVKPQRLFRSDEVQGPGYVHNYVDIISPANGDIKWIKSFNGKLLVFKTDSIFVADGLIGDATFNVRPLSLTVGVKYGRTVKEVPSLGLVFQGTDKHFYALRPEGVNQEHPTFYRLSSHISNIIDNMAFSSYDPKQVAAVYNDEYWCSTPSTYTAPWCDTVLAFDFKRVQPHPTDQQSLVVPWTVYNSMYIGCVANNQQYAYNGTYLTWSNGCAGDEYPQLYNAKFPSSSPAVAGYFITKPLSFGHPHRMKRLAWIEIVAREATGSTITSQINVDNTGWTSLDNITLTPITSASRFTQSLPATPEWSYQSYRLDTNFFGKVFQLRVDTSAGSNACQISEIRFRYSLEEAR